VLSQQSVLLLHFAGLAIKPTAAQASPAAPAGNASLAAEPHRCVRNSMAPVLPGAEACSASSCLSLCVCVCVCMCVCVCVCVQECLCVLRVCVHKSALFSGMPLVYTTSFMLHG
jgi:hypothetical protein